MAYIGITIHFMGLSKVALLDAMGLPRHAFKHSV